MSRGISLNQEAILRWMQHDPGRVATANNLQEVVPASRPSLSRALGSLEKRGLISKLGAGGYQLNSLGNPRESVFVGRQRELEELRATLEDALAGRGRLVMLVGEPGIGKTRTAQELAAYGIERGCQALWGRCYSAQGAPPYWPWVQVIRSYTREHSPEEISSQMGAGAADIAEVVSGVREKLPGLESPPTLEPQQARFRFFDSMAAFLMRASQAQPLVVILDNLHWADRPSLLLLEFLAQELAECRLLVVGTYRDTELNRRHPLTQTLGELAKEPSFQRVPLRGLSEGEVDQFLKGMAGFTPPRDLVTAVHTQTEGNPLFMTQVVQLLIQEGELTPVRERQSWNIAIPVGVREVIGRRLDRLSEDCNYALTLASVIGREFELGLLERLVADPTIGVGRVLSEEELLEAVAEALAAGVIEEIPLAASRYQFSHVLIQDTLAWEMLAARRARLHRRIAESLEELYGDNIEAHAGELAYHFAQAAIATDREKLVRYSLLAGERALATYAHEEAMTHFERGLEAKGGQPISTSSGHAIDAEMAALLFGLGRARVATRQPFFVPEYLTNLRLALDYYIQEGNVERAVEVAEYPAWAALGVSGGEAELLSRALALVPSDSHQAGRLLSTYGLVLYQETGDYQAAQEALGRAKAIALEERDQVLEMRTLANATDVHFHHLRWSELLENGQQVLDLAQWVEDPNSDLVAHYNGLRALVYSGNYDGAKGHAGDMLAASERWRHRNWLGQALAYQGYLAQLRGEWQETRVLLDRGLALLPQDPPILCTRTFVEHQAGDFSQGQVYLEQLLDSTRRPNLGAGAA